MGRQRRSGQLSRRLPEKSGQRFLLVDRPGSTQANFLPGQYRHPGRQPRLLPRARDEPRLGGTFTSRLVQNIREEKGYTYSIGSGFSYPADTGRFVVSAAVRNDVIVPALEEVFKEIERIQTEPLTDQEISDARDGIVGEFVFGLETYQDFVESVASYKIRGVELDRLNKWLGHIKDVTKDDVLDIANTYIHPEDFIIVVVGDAGEIQEQLDNAGRGHAAGSGVSLSKSRPAASEH